MEIKRFFQFEIIIALSALFEFSVMGLGPVYFFSIILVRGPASHVRI